MGNTDFPPGAGLNTTVCLWHILSNVHKVHLSYWVAYVNVLDTYRDNGSLCWDKQDQSASITAARFHRCITRKHFKASRTSPTPPTITPYILFVTCVLNGLKLWCEKNKHCLPASLVLQLLWKKRVPWMHLKENLWYAYWWSIVSKRAETPQIPCGAGGAPKTHTVH